MLPALPLGGMHREIGSMLCLLKVARFRLVEINANRGADPHMMAVHADGLRDDLDRKRRDRFGRFGTHRRYADAEFVAAHAHHEGFGESRAQAVRDDLQEAVATLVSQEIVHILEAAEIDGQKRGLLAEIAIDGFEIRLGELTIVKAGQRIVEGKEFNAVLGVRAAGRFQAKVGETPPSINDAERADDKDGSEDVVGQEACRQRIEDLKLRGGDTGDNPRRYKSDGIPFCALAKSHIFPFREHRAQKQRRRRAFSPCFAA
nr:hypothetical protein [Fulvimarina manganoxydans]